MEMDDIIQHPWFLKGLPDGALDYNRGIEKIDEELIEKTKGLQVSASQTLWGFLMGGGTVAPPNCDERDTYLSMLAIDFAWCNPEHFGMFMKTEMARQVAINFMMSQCLLYFTMLCCWEYYCTCACGHIAALVIEND